MKSKEEILESGLLEQYALGLTSGEENQTVSQYLEKYPDLKEHLDSIERAMEIIAQQQAIVPPAKLRAATIQKIQDLDTPRFSSFSKWVTGIAATIAILAIGYGLKLNGDMHNLSSDIDALENQLSLMDKDCQLVKDDYATSQRLLSMYRDDNYLPVQLKGNQLMPEGDMVVFWNTADKKACMKINQLSAPPDGHIYQIWADVDGKMLSVGTFKNEGEILDLKFLENATSLNVTIEKGNGQEHPDVSKLIMSNKV